MDKARADMIHLELSMMMRDFAKKHGLSVSPLKGSFTSTEMKISCTLGDTEAIGSSEVNPEYVRNLKRNGILYGLTLDHLERQVTIGSRIGLKFVGLRGKKALMRDTAGKDWLYDAMLVGQLMKTAK